MSAPVPGARAVQRRRPTTLRLDVVVALLALLCGAAGCPRGSASTAPPSAGGSAAGAGSASGSGQRDGKPPFEGTTLAPFANDVAALTMAAVDGASLPQVALTVEPDPGEPRVRYVGRRPGTPLQPVAVLLRLDVVLAEQDEQDADAAPARWVLGVLVGRAALRVVQMEARTRPRPLARAPAFDRALRETAQQLLDSTADGEPPVAEHDEEALGAARHLDALTRRMAELEALRPRLRNAIVREAGLDDVAVIARDGNGGRWLVELRVGATEGRAVIRGGPLARVAALSAD